MVWLTPAMDSLFTGAASERRRFIDRLSLSLDPAYAAAAATFDRAMRQRNKALEDMSPAKAARWHRDADGGGAAGDRGNPASRDRSPRRRNRGGTQPRARLGFPLCGLSLAGQLEAQVAAMEAPGLQMGEAPLTPVPSPARGEGEPAATVERALPSPPPNPLADLAPLEGGLAKARSQGEGIGVRGGSAMQPSSLAELRASYTQLLARSRARDREAGRTLTGPHRSDLQVKHGPKDMPAKMCSTGEQKALLVGLALAQARLVKQVSGGIAPLILLDEIAAHLDEDRRAALFSSIASLNAQVWMTGTDRRHVCAAPGCHRSAVFSGV